ncbi:MAG TPA: TlpA disulfide reductase family protein [Candidatus Acidoferrum sp.]|nr:TlpA disulfide reductase family protein [Candidatus Acidoferrum sp.]
MMTKNICARTTILTVLLLGALAVFGDTKGKEPARRFHAKTMDGQNFTNESIKGKVVLFEFWTTWCGYCVGEAPFVDQIAQEFKGKGLVVLAVDVGDSKKTVKKYLEAHPRACPIVLMEDTNLAAMYEATVYPIYVLIDRDGYIAGTQRGAAGEMALRRFLRRVGIGSDSNTEN